MAMALVSRLLLLLLLLAILGSDNARAQQTYNEADQLGYVCTGTNSCPAYASYRALPGDTLLSVGTRFGLSVVQVADASRLPTSASISAGQLLLVPLNCSCHSGRSTFNTTYIIQMSDTMYLVSLTTFEGLTTWQALMNANPTFDPRALQPGDKIIFPIRCSCPSASQTQAGVRSLVTYSVRDGDTVAQVSSDWNLSTSDLVSENLDPNLATNLLANTTLLLPVKSDPPALPTTRTAPGPASPAATATSPPTSSTRDGSLSTGAKAGIAVGAILAASMFAGLAIHSAYLARNRWFLLQEDREDDQYFKSLPALPPRFTFKELKSATWKFSKPLGTGGFGTVYEGRIADGTGVAVKKLDGGRQGRKEFRAEVATIGSISHVNLVRLRGFCSENFQRLLVYELLPNGSLDKWLFSRDRPLLTWSQRFNIAVGTARGLAYLHSECREPVLHLDVKPENILLDASMTPKVSDFGMSKLIDRDKSRVETTMRGTPGYMAPEWLLHNGATTKCDVYSYGLVLLELLAGRRNVEFISAAADGVQLTSACYFPAMLVTRVMSSSGFDPTDVVDKRLGGDVDAEQVRRLVNAALLCIQEEPELRPSMEVVMQILETSLDVDRVVDATSMNFPF